MARPARPWFRFYTEAISDRKLRRLKPEFRWLWVVVLAAARQSPEPGWLLLGESQPLTWDDLTDMAALPLKAVEQGTDALHDAGMLAFDSERQAWFVPKWWERQYESDTSSQRTAKHRAKNGERTPQGTPPETEGKNYPPNPPQAGGTKVSRANGTSPRQIAAKADEEQRQIRQLAKARHELQKLNDGGYVGEELLKELRFRVGPDLAAKALEQGASA